MTFLSRPRARGSAATLTALTLTALVAWTAPAGATADQAKMPHLDFRGEATVAAGSTFAGTVVGGLSSITYDRGRDVYYAISDARPELGQGTWRFYTLRISLGDGRLDPGDVTVVGVTPLTDPAGVPFPDATVDPEGLTLTDRGTLVVTSEGFALPTNAVAPWVREFGLDGRQLRDIPLPSYADPVPGVSGVRNNLGPESAAVTSNGRFLFTGFENALVQDGPAATLSSGSPARLQKFDARTGELRRELVYPNDPVAEAPVPAGSFTVNGLVELLPTNPRFLLSMERSFSVGAGNTVRLHRVSLAGATNVAGVADLDDAGRVRPVGKRLLVDLDVLGLTLDNLEGMTLGPRLPDGGRALVLLSDNTIPAGQDTQLLLFSARHVGR
jgi:hypothetical protein